MERDLLIRLLSLFLKLGHFLGDVLFLLRVPDSGIHWMCLFVKLILYLPLGKIKVISL